MAANAKPRTPASALHLEKQISNKYFVDPPKPSSKPQSRNPITQDDVEISESKPRKNAPVIARVPGSQGIAMGTFAEKSKRSDIFGDPEESNKASRKYIPHSSSETYIQPMSLKKSDYQPPPRNPITQDTIENSNPRVRTKISESSAFAHLYETEPEVPKVRDNI
jgi:hypothetical protein